MEITQLKNVGLNEKESKIYTTLLELKESSVAKISKKAGINRSLSYFILSDLEKKGFVSYIIKNNIKFYKPIEPQKILNLLEEKKKSFQSILPQLIELSKKSGVKPQIEILEGKEGIKTILNEVLRLKKEWFAYNVPGKGPETLGYLIDNFENQRQKKKILLKVMCINTPQGKKRGADFSKMKFTQVKYMKDAYESPASNWIYGDRFVIIFWYEDSPFAIRIIDRKLADSYKKYFNALWKVSKK